MDFWKGFSLAVIGTLFGLVVGGILYAVSIFFFDGDLLRCTFAAVIMGVIGTAFWYDTSWYVFEPSEMLVMSVFWSGPCIWCWTFGADLLISTFGITQFDQIANRTFWQGACGVLTVGLVGGMTGVRNGVFLEAGKR